MTQHRDEVAGFAPGTGRSLAATLLFVVGLLAVSVNSALYFFDVEALSHPAISVFGLALLVPLYLQERYGDDASGRTSRSGKGSGQTVEDRRWR